MTPTRIAIASGCAAALCASALLAQSYPNRAVRIVVPYLSGGAGDVVARTIAQKLSETWNVSVYIDNRPGGATKIGTELAAKSPPDGYTLFMATPASAANVSLYQNMPYDLARDFTAVGLVDISPQVLVIHPALPVKNVKDLIALAKAHPGQLNFASSGIAGSVHLAGELFKSMAGINIVHVPYRGFTQVLVDLLSGQVAMSFSTLQSAYPFIKSGKLRVLAVTSLKRTPTAPDLPTVSEAALPGYEMVVWHMLLAPAATPPDIVNKFNAEIARALKQADVKTHFENLGVDVVGGSAAESNDYLKSEIVKYTKLIRNAGIKPE